MTWGDHPQSVLCACSSHDLHHFTAHNFVVVQHIQHNYLRLCCHLLVCVWWPASSTPWNPRYNHTGFYSLTPQGLPGWQWYIPWLVGSTQLCLCINCVCAERERKRRWDTSLDSEYAEHVHEPPMVVTPYVPHTDLLVHIVTDKLYKCPLTQPPLV